MPHPLEAVYKDTELKATEKAVMAYLVYRANGDGLCWPGASAIQKDCGISRNTRIRTISNLVDMGRIIITEGGQGRGNTQMIEISSRYIKGTKYDTFSSQEKVPNMTPFNEEKVPEMGPINEEKVPNLTQKVPNLNVEEQEELINNNYSSDPVRILISKFEELTLLNPPHSSSTEYREYWVPYFERWLGLCDQDAVRTSDLMTAAVQELRNNDNGKTYRITRPKSIDIAISNLVATRGVDLEPGPNYGQDFDTYFPIMASRHASLRDANAPEYVVQAMTEIGRGEFQSCTEFGKSSLRTRFINIAKTYYQQVPS